MPVRFIKRLCKGLGCAEIEREVWEELRFHCERLTEEYQEMGLSEEAARDATRRRFGNLEQVQAECVEIGRRSRPTVRLLKLFLLLFFIAGLWLRMISVELPFKQLADLMMAVSMLCQLLLHVKGMKATGFQAIKRGVPLSILGLGAKPTVEAYDAEGRTPVERLVHDRVFKDS